MSSLSYTLTFCSLLLLSFSSSSSSSSEFTVSDKFLHCLSIYASPTVSNVIYTPKNSSFITVLHSYNRNLRFLTPKTRKPLVIITATHYSHAQATVTCAKSLRLQIRIRSGGHDYEGLSYTSNVPFVLLDLFNLRKITPVVVDGHDDVLSVEAGATVGELYYYIAKEKPLRAFPAAVCPTVGVGGHFSGGGYGNLMRKFGLSVDNIIDALIVDSNGKILDRKAMGEDVFWAIRGGGAASFGVVLSWRIQLVQVPKNVVVFKVSKTIEQGAADVVHRWQYVAPNLPKDLFIRASHDVVESSTIEGEYTVRVSFIGLFLGSINKLVSITNKSFPELGLNQTDCIETSWIESTFFWYGLPMKSPIEILLERPKNGSNFSKNRSDYVKQPISKKSIMSIWKKMMDLEFVSMQWNPYGGRMNEIPESATPFPHRSGNLFKIQYLLSWSSPSGREDGGGEIETTIDYYLNISKSFYDFMTPFVSSSPREAFLNYRDLDIGANPSDRTNFAAAIEFGRKYFKGNFDRLVRTKTETDPYNFFRHEQSIPPYTIN